MTKNNNQQDKPSMVTKPILTNGFSGEKQSEITRASVVQDKTADRKPDIELNVWDCILIKCLGSASSIPSHPSRGCMLGNIKASGSSTNEEIIEKVLGNKDEHRQYSKKMLKEAIQKALSLKEQENKSYSKSDVIEKSVTSMDANKVPDKSTDMDRRQLLSSLQEKIEKTISDFQSNHYMELTELDRYINESDIIELKEEISKIFKEMGK